MKLFGLIQARMGSSRLPGKVMLPLAGAPLVWHIAHRLERVKPMDGIVLATTSDSRNDPMVDYARAQGWHVARYPDEDDIVGRMALAFERTGADAVLKVNADCPMPDVGVMQDVVDAFLATPGCEYAANKFAPIWPAGLTAEIVTHRLIGQCDTVLKSPEERELVMKWIIDHGGQFTTAKVPPPHCPAMPGLMIDTPEEYREMQSIFDALYPANPAFGWQDVRALLKIDA